MTNLTQQHNICEDCIHLRENPLRCTRDSTKEITKEKPIQFCSNFTENW